MTVLRLAAGVLGTVLMVSPAMAQDPVWSPAMTDAVGSASKAITQSQSQEQRLVALEDAVKALEPYNAEPGGSLTASMLEGAYAGEYALHWTDMTFDDMGLSETLSDEQAQTYVASLATNIAVLSKTGTVLPSEAIRIADAIERYDTAMDQAWGLPFDEVLAQLIDDPALAEQILSAIDNIRTLASGAREAEDLDAADAAAVAAYMRSILDRIPSQAGPAFGGPATVAFGEVLEWNGEMYDAATDGLDIVANGIETGQVDTTRLRAVEDRLNELRRGPWGGDTARGFAGQWCERLSSIARECEGLVDALVRVFEDEDEDDREPAPRPAIVCSQFDYDVDVVTSDFLMGTEDWAIFGDAHGLKTDAGGLQVTDDAVGDVWYWDAPRKFLGCRERFYGGVLAFNLRIDVTDALFDGADVILVGVSSGIHVDLAPNPGTDWTPYAVPLSVDAGWISSETGALATDQEIRSALRNIQALRIRGEYRTGPDMGWLSDVEMNAAPKHPSGD